MLFLWKRLKENDEYKVKKLGREIGKLPGWYDQGKETLIDAELFVLFDVTIKENNYRIST